MKHSQLLYQDIEKEPFFFNVLSQDKLKHLWQKKYNFIASVLHKSGSFSASNSHALVPFLFYGKKCTHRRSAHHPSSPLSPCSPSAFLSLPLLPQGRTRPTDGASFPACAHGDHRADAAQSAHGGGKRASSASSQGRKGEKVHFCEKEKNSADGGRGMKKDLPIPALLTAAPPAALVEKSGREILAKS